jgi:hypothetical protein
MVSRLRRFIASRHAACAMRSQHSRVILRSEITTSEVTSNSPLPCSMLRSA